MPVKVVTLFLLLFCLALLGQQTLCCADDYVFRKVKWGMQPDDILASEADQGDSLLLSDSRASLVYKMNIYDSEAEVMYVCSVDGLETIRVEVVSPALGAKNRRDTVAAFAKALDKKYGKTDWGRDVLPDAWLTPDKYIILVTSRNKDGAETVGLLYMPPGQCDLKPAPPIDQKYLDNL